MIDRAGQVWDNGGSVILILETTSHVKTPPDFLHTVLRLYDELGDEGHVGTWIENCSTPYESVDARWLKRIA